MAMRRRHLGQHGSVGTSRGQVSSDGARWLHRMEPSSAGTAVGFVIGFRRGDLGYVSVLAVRPALQRRGIGRALLGAAIAYLRGLGPTRVQVHAFTDRPAAVGSYLAAGFEIVHTYRDDAGPTGLPTAGEGGAA
jgi:ribosomal protein S18 acetylase RimI-like enzyme